MLLILQVLSVLLTATAMALSLAHALELPGKLRLDRPTYCAVQQIYYPGFTFGGFGEVLGLLAILGLLIVTPVNSPAFPWTLLGLIGLAATHATYWALTHPINNFWLKDMALHSVGGGFFKMGAETAHDDDAEQSWRRARNRWEASHVIRAVLSIIGFIGLVIGLAIR